MRLRPRLLMLPLSLCAFSCLLTCSKKSSPTNSQPPDVTTVGVLLSGADAASALSGTIDHGPFAVPDAEWSGDFVTTRLEGVFNPSAAVGEVNGALNAISAKISCMRAGMMFVELVVAPQANVAAAAQICTTLVTSGAFLSAYPCHKPTALNEVAVFPGFPANGIATHLEKARFPAAWNVRDRVAASNNVVTVLVADHFRAFTQHAEIPSQTFVSGNGLPDMDIDSTGAADGNHGFFVAGTVGARFDDVGTTGAFADPGGILRLPCLSVTGFGSWTAIIAELASHLPATGQFILNTSVGFIADFTDTPKRQRAEVAMFWRFLVAGRQSRFLHTQSAGNEGNASPSLPNADNNSPFSLSARFNTPLEMLQGTQVATQDTVALNLLYEAAVNTNALFGAKLQNVLVVGSSDLDGNLSTFSNVPADVRMIGETVSLPCIFDDSSCDPGTGVPLQAIVNGTSFAAPQVAALAAWLWALNPGLTVEQTIATLRNCFDGRWVDAYKAVLSLDNNLASANIRRSILDVANATGQVGSNGTFDDADLRMLVDSIQAFEFDRISGSPPFALDHSIFDLNGDGYTGDTMGVPSPAPFDLNINTPPTFSTVSPPECADTSFNESAVTDWDILYYYAHSSLYVGVDSVRDQLLPCGGKVVATGAEYLANVDVQGVTLLSTDPFITDTLADNQQSSGTSAGSEPLAADLSVIVSCGISDVRATARMQLSYFTTAGDEISGLSGQVACAESTPNSDDTLCISHAAGALSRYFAGFNVTERPVAFTISGSTSMTSGRATLTFGGVEEIFALGPNENGGMSGELPPGNYAIGVRSGGDGDVSFSISFAPIPVVSSARPAVSVRPK